MLKSEDIDLHTNKYADNHPTRDTHLFTIYILPVQRLYFQTLFDAVAQSLLIIVLADPC